MASGKNSRAVRNARAAVVTKRSTPWGMIAAVLVVVLFAGAIFGYYVVQNNAKQAKAAALAEWTPSRQQQGPVRQDPRNRHPAVRGRPARRSPNQQVAYTHSPPFGGTHDGYWAACNGVVYPTAVRSENMVHALEHGAVWIAYNPDKITGDALKTLRAKIDGQPYSLMSPYPGLDQPISLQSWGHQLKLSDPNDPRIDQFIQSLRSNQYQYPEPGASCAALGPGQFDQDNPPPFAPAPPVSAVNNTTVMPEVIAGAQGVTPRPGQVTALDYPAVGARGSPGTPLGAAVRHRGGGARAPAGRRHRRPAHRPRGRRPRCPPPTRWTSGSCRT